MQTLQVELERCQINLIIKISEKPANQSTAPSTTSAIVNSSNNNNNNNNNAESTGTQPSVQLPAVESVSSPTSSTASSAVHESSVVNTSDSNSSGSTSTDGTTAANNNTDATTVTETKNNTAEVPAPLPNKESASDAELRAQLSLAESKLHAASVILAERERQLEARSEEQARDYNLLLVLLYLASD